MAKSPARTSGTAPRIILRMSWSPSPTGQRLRRLALLSAVAACTTAGCGGSPAPPQNVLIISIDTLRADHLGCYGYDRDATPRLDRFAERSTRYANALAPAPWTLPSHVAMLTGRHPFEIGVANQKNAIPAAVATLAECLATAGYQTAAFVDSRPKGFVGAERGFGRGFDQFKHAPHGRDWTYSYDMALTARAAERWLEERDPERPFFLFLHTKTVHTVGVARNLDGDMDAPYHTPREYRTRFMPAGAMAFRWSDEQTKNAGAAYLIELNRELQKKEPAAHGFPKEKLEELIALYDGGIYYTDEHVGMVLDTLDRLDLAADTLVIVTADHGEAFLEHNQFFHEQLYGALLRVPLIVHDPRVTAERVVETPVSLVDIAPTVLARLGVEIPSEMTGRSLPLATEASRAAPAVFSAIVRDRGGEVLRSGAIHEGSWKLIHQRKKRASTYTTELFRLFDDPLDVQPVLDEAERMTAMLERLEEWLAGQGQGSASLELDEETLDALRALGYGE